MRRPRANRSTQKPKAKATPEPTFMTIDLPQLMNPLSRGAIDDEVDEALREAGIGETTGGGGFIPIGNPPPSNPRFCGSKIDVEVADVKKGLAIMRHVLKRLRVPEATTITQHSEAIIVHKVYGA